MMKHVAAVGLRGVKTVAEMPAFRSGLGVECDCLGGRLLVR
jgi:hypothetical protein